MHNQQPAMVYEAVERETARTTYPEAFPALPEVPAGRYCDPQFYELEIQHLWRKSWLHAGHESELPKPGSYKLFEQLGLSIIISRGLSGELRAFHNICRTALRRCCSRNRVSPDDSPAPTTAGAIRLTAASLRCRASMTSPASTNPSAGCCPCAVKPCAA